MGERRASSAAGFSAGSLEAHGARSLFQGMYSHNGVDDAFVELDPGEGMWDKAGKWK